jgi:hypothetical protein
LFALLRLKPAPRGCVPCDRDILIVVTLVGSSRTPSRDAERVETRKAREAQGDVEPLDSRKRKQALWYAFPPSRRGWEIEDLEESPQGPGHT